MAGAGYKLFATGDVLTAAQVNTFLMQQTVMVFASSAARTSALSGVLAEGMVSYLQDTNTLEVYDGAAWVGATGDITALTAGTGISISSATGPVPTVTNAMATEITAKGDLIVGTGSATFDNLAAGSNGDTLVADSSTSTGLRYQPNFSAGKNAIINGAFDVWQRGTSFSVNNSGAYTADRFIADNLGIATITQQTFTPGTAPVAGYEGQFFLRYTQTSAGAAFFLQRIEDVRKFAGQTITVSVWAKANATLSLAGQVRQNFGTGGSANANITLSTQTVTTSWARYSWTITLPSLAGATIGAGNYLQMRLDLPSSGTFTFDTWGWQVEAGNTATAFQTATGTIQGELAACQRYFQTLGGNTTGGVGSGFAYGTTTAAINCRFIQTMRTAPTVSLGTGAVAADFDVYKSDATNANATAVSFQSAFPTSVRALVTVASGLVAGNGTEMKVQANNSSIWASAEL